MSEVIGVDIGGTKIAAGVVNATGDVGTIHTVSTTAQAGMEAVIARVIAICEALLDDPAANVAAVGIGTAGQVDFNTGVMVFANDNLPGWTGKPLAAPIADALGLPVYVDNDVNALALGETRFGAARGYRHVLYIAVGTGIGGAIVLNGQVWHGAHFMGGEMGYFVAGWDGQAPQIVESLAGGPGIARQYQQRVNRVEPLSLHDITGLAQQGDILAQAVIRDGARLAGQVLSPVVCFIDPEIIVIGGGVPEIGPLWWEPFNEALLSAPRSFRRDIPVVRSQLSTVVGAACVALDRLV